MKIGKITILVTILISALVSEANAKRQRTEGFIFGIDSFYASATHQYVTDQKFKTTKFKDSAFGYGANIKYAYNVDDLMPMEPLIPFFVFGEIFWQNLGTSAKNRNEDIVDLNSRYGAKIGMGLDFADDFFLYGSLGGASVDYEIDWTALNINLADDLKKKSGSNIGIIYGAGVGYYLTKNFIISFELNNQRVELDSIVFPSVNAENDEPIGNTDKVRTNILAMQLGLSYKF